MFRRNHTTFLPLLLSGLPVFAMNWLRIAGIPTAPIQSTQLCREGKNAAGQILVFDARDATGRMDSRMARENGAETINVADLLPRNLRKLSGDDDDGRWDLESSQGLRAAFLGELKLRIESVGGFWLRLADYPFPYQSAICCCSDPAATQRDFTAEFAITADGNSSEEPPTRNENKVAWIGEQHATGQPIFYRDNRLKPFDAGFNQPPVVDGDEHPLMWQTTGEELLQWTRLRAQIALAATKVGSTYRVQWTGNCGRYRPTVELWLGTHVASLPLADQAMTLREEGILFVQEHRRHPAGVAAGWSGDTHRSHIWESRAHQSV